MKPTFVGRFSCLLEGAESIMQKNQPKQVPKQKPNEDTKKTMKKGKYTIPIQMV